MHEEYRGNEYSDSKLMRKRYVPPVVCILLVTLVVFIGVFSYGIYKTMLDVYEDDVNIESVNKKYLRVVTDWDKNDSSYIISPLASDLSLTDIVKNGDTDSFIKASSVDVYNRGYKSFNESVEWIKNASKEESINLIDMSRVKEEKLREIIGNTYETKLEVPKGTFKDTDMVAVVKLPNKLAGKVAELDNHLFMSGTYYEDEGRIKVDFADGKHEAIFYKGAYVDDFQWKKQEGVLKLPKVTFSSASTMKQSLGGIKGDFNCITSQIAVFSLIADEKVRGATPIATSEITTPYKVVIFNKEAGIVVAGGTVKS